MLEVSDLLLFGLQDPVIHFVQDTSEILALSFIEIDWYSLSGSAGFIEFG